jgi:hypothetical protein
LSCVLPFRARVSVVFVLVPFLLIHMSLIKLKKSNRSYYLCRWIEVCKVALFDEYIQPDLLVN